MLKACLLVKTVPVKGNTIQEQISKIKGIKKVFQTFGRVDMVVFIETNDLDDVLDVIARVHLLDGVRSTETLLEAW